MSDDRSFGRADRSVGEWLERAARRMGRRKFLVNGMKAAAVTVAGVTVGAWPKQALAHPEHTYCHYPRGVYCTQIAGACPSGGGCPSGCYVCTTASGCSGCIYSSGYWATRSGSCGSQGYGYYLCYDCRCTSCSRTCGCRSSCRCGGCLTAADVKADMDRAMAEHAAAAS